MKGVCRQSGPGRFVRYARSKHFGLILCAVGSCLFPHQQAHARLPRAIHVAGTIFSLDAGSKTLVFQVANRKKPLLLEWNKETEFFDGRKMINPEQIAPPLPATIDYKDLTFRHSLLKKVVVGINGQVSAGAAGD
jgi:hypothetical protein